MNHDDGYWKVESGKKRRRITDIIIKNRLGVLVCKKKGIKKTSLAYTST